MKPTGKKIIFLVTCFLFLVADSSFAAELFFESGKGTLRAGDQFELGLFLNTESGEPINAVGAKILYGEDLLEFHDIRSGDSAVNFWIEPPTLQKSGDILFSGIIPGGYQGTKGKIFSLIFKVKKSGVVVISIDSAKALLNDGKGTSANLKARTLELSLGESLSDFKSISVVIDTLPPEDFKPEIVQNSDMFDGQWFAVFATQDKDSGIDHYEVREGRWGIFTEATSPYALKRQSLDKKIFVKAIDKAGNERIAELVAPRMSFWYQTLIIFGIILLILIVFVCFLLKTLWPKFPKQL